MSCSCAEGLTGHAYQNSEGEDKWNGHLGGRPSVTGKITRRCRSLLFPNGQTVRREDFNWEGDSEDGNIDLFSQDPDDWDCCEISIRIVSVGDGARKEQLKDLYAAIVKEARALGFTDADWSEANSKADA